MSQKKSVLSETTGLPPGTVVHVGEHFEQQVSISAIHYNEETLKEQKIANFVDDYTAKGNGVVNWINVDGLEDIHVIEAIGRRFGLDALILEDVANTEQRPKVEFFDKYIFFALKMLSYDKKTHVIHSEQVSFVLGENYVISFQERSGDVFDPVRYRLRKRWGNMRYRKADYLVYSLIDVVVDNYFLVLENIRKRIESLENQSTDDVGERWLRLMQRVKREIQMVKKAIHPLREAVNKLQRDETNLIEERTIKFFNDVNDHTLHAIEEIDSYYEHVSSVQQIYLSNLSHKMNQVIQVLTIISTIFIPLTFIVGVYGMNFRVMPELTWKYGYWAIWGIMVGVAGLLLAFFKRKRWI